MSLSGMLATSGLLTGQGRLCVRMMRGPCVGSVNLEFAHAISTVPNFPAKGRQLESQGCVRQASAVARRC